jgi:hypothetical protein
MIITLECWGGPGDGEAVTLLTPDDREATVLGDLYLRGYVRTGRPIRVWECLLWEPMTRGLSKVDQ